MKRQHPETEAIIVPVAGICNVGHGKCSTAAAHFLPVRFLLQRKLHVPVLDPIVLPGLGVLQPTEKTYEHFEQAVHEATDAHPNAQVLLLPHSLGGLVCRELLGRNDALGRNKDSRYLGAITLGTPHDELDERRWPWLCKKVVANINAFAKDIPPLTDTVDGAPRLALVGAKHDFIVPPASALPPGIAMASRHLLDNFAVEHNLLVCHPEAMALTARLASGLLHGEPLASNIEDSMVFGPYTSLPVPA
jgi:pimeloyl-ACP methyl ester carboxylesterase